MSSMHLLPAYWTTTNHKKRKRKKKLTPSMEKSLIAHEKYLAKMGVDPNYVRIPTPLKTGSCMSIYKCNKYPEKDFDMNLNKITPLHTKDWYVKWVSSIVLISAQLSTAMGVELFPDYPLTMVLYLVGILGWLLVAYWWHDRALMILNSIGAFIMATGIVKFYFGVL